VGSAVAKALLSRGEAVTIVTRNTSKKSDWEQRGAKVAVADVHDADELRDVFRKGQRVFVLNPPGDPTGDSEAAEHATLKSILSALDGSDVEKVVAQSTYGAQPGPRIGDLGVLYEMEQALAARSIPLSVVRGAYYMSNWDASLESAEREGIVTSFFPADFALPMVAPHDLGQFAAMLMMEPVERTGLHHVEGPEPYSAADVAAAFSAELGRAVAVNVVPRLHWIQTFRAVGFSPSAAESYAGMTGVTLDRRYEPSSAPVRSETSLASYVRDLVGRAVPR
jgi:uncharacterized protein YbjT (DUF2867 family)